MRVSDSSTSLLLKAATPDLYRRNAFRLTGLPVTASAREVARQADKLKMLADLGGQAAQQLSVIPGMEPPTAEEVREATQRLKDVEARALDEFFWFWPEDWEKPESDEAFAAIKRHDLDAAFTIWASREVETESFIASRNIALVLHMRSIEWALLDFTHPLDADRLGKVHGYWKESFDRWEWLVYDDRLWDAFKARIRQINDPALTTGYARRLRCELPQAFDKINAELALSYAQHGRRAEAQWHVDFLKSTHSGQDNVSATLDTVLAPSRERLERAIESAWQATKADKRSGTTQARKLLDAAEPLLAVFDMFHETDSAERCQLFDEVAESALGCAVNGYNACNAIEPSKKIGEDFLGILQRAKKLATAIDLRQRIIQNIEIAQGNLSFNSKVKPLMDKLAEIQKITSLPPHFAKQLPDYKLDRVKSEVIPKLDSLLESKELDEEAVINLCDSVAIVLRGIALSANNDFNNPAVAHGAITLAGRYARSTELLEQVAQETRTIWQNLLNYGRNMAGSYSTLSELSQTSNPSARPIPGSGYIAQIILGVLVLAFVWISELINDSSSTTSKDKEKVEDKDGSDAYRKEPPASNLDNPIQSTQPTASPDISSQKKESLVADELEKIKAASKKASLAHDGYRIWKNQAGKELFAKMLSFDGANLVLKTEDGKTYSYSQAGLSVPDQLEVYRLSGYIKNPKTGVYNAPSELPPTGLMDNAVATASNYGPLTIQTQAGSGNYYIKLVETNNRSQPITAFVRDGQTASKLHIPAGTYELKYATGKSWYGEELLFGDDTSYSKADSTFSFGGGSGYTVELYKQVNGNLPTSAINKNNF
jgi:hypothetical protein